ncbi:MAG TPA: SpoIID/LytB domain-containing protein [Candidatus Acidoferrum sp.]|nr:SpoIID/LytB domain-containing protein [Candidatus Acidoferrum sp.]
MVISRAIFLKTIGAMTVATGGLDIWDPVATQIRVLVAPDTRGESPQIFADGTFVFGGRRWRGEPSTVDAPGGRLALVTSIDVDQYLQGVVPLESPPSWPQAALEAQAIVARTFALSRRTISRPYDVLASDADQRWGGVEAESRAATAAIEATRGQTLTFAGGPAAVFYSACCGGHTEDIVEAWGGAPLPYLRGVADPHCAPAPDFRWTRSAPLDRVLAALGGRTGGSLTGASLVDPDSFGRPRAVVLQGAANVTLPVVDFRRALGYEIVRSLWLRTVRVDATQAVPQLVIEGSGRGHGVGLCQWGSRFFAAAGASAGDILGFYFPGTSVSRG